MVTCSHVNDCDISSVRVSGMLLEIAISVVDSATTFLPGSRRRAERRTISGEYESKAAQKPRLVAFRGRAISKFPLLPTCAHDDHGTEAVLHRQGVPAVGDYVSLDVFLAVGIRGSDVTGEDERFEPEFTELGRDLADNLLCTLMGVHDAHMHLCAHQVNSR